MWPEITCLLVLCTEICNMYHSYDLREKEREREIDRERYREREK